MSFRKKNFRGKSKGNGYANKQGVRGDYDAIPSENALYEHFYKQNGFIGDEAEWTDFWAALKRTLPTTFRFTGSKGNALNTLKALKETYIPHLEGIEFEGEMVQAPTAISWYPDELAWTMTVGKSTIRRCPPFRKFQNFLVAETTVGNISRQEAVSMIPPLLMDVQPHHTVLDLCAAPGSKTAQLIEMVHNGEEAAVEAAVAQEVDEASLTKAGDLGGRPTGMVIANDADYKRSHMLIHQTKRLNSPNLIVTNHDATMYPSLLTTDPTEVKKEYLKFDRILADVPCSGDGTARKNYSVWKDWNPNNAFNLHMTQVRILIRGLQMLKVGGRIVYSTCSMNPVENEAVVAAAIDRCGGLSKVNIVDVSDKLPELKRRPGLKGGWKVMDKEKNWYSTYEEVGKEDAGRDGRLSRMLKTIFPTEDGKTDDDPTRIPLERCVRVYPHQQDTGGFFITVLEKKEEIRAVKPEDSARRKMAAAARAHEKSLQTADLEEADVKDEEMTEIPAADSEPSAPPSPGKRKLESPAPNTTVKKLKAVDLEDDALLLQSPPPIPAAKSEANKGSSSSKKGKGPPAEEPFKYLPSDHAVLQTIYEFYGLSPRFPRTCFMVRNAEAIPTRAIYFTSEFAKKILVANEGKGVKFVHCGVKAFMKQDVQSPETCPWRIQNEGLPITAPWIGPTRVLNAHKRETVHALLRELFPKVNAEAKKTDAVAADEVIDVVEAGSATADETREPRKTIDEIEEQVRAVSMGCCVLRVAAHPSEFSEPMLLPLWRSRHSCNLMLPKDERKAMLLRLFNDTTEIKDSTNKNRVQYRDRQTQKDESTVTGLEHVSGGGDGEEKGGEAIEDAGEGANVSAVGTRGYSAKVSTEEEVKERVAEKDAKKEENQIKDEVMGGAEM